MNRKAKNPITTDGTPASTSRIGFKILRSRGRAYSERYIAAPSPSGVATTMAIRLTIRVCQTIGPEVEAIATREPAVGE